jgi:hypothetical protein
MDSSMASDGPQVDAVGIVDVSSDDAMDAGLDAPPEAPVDALDDTTADVVEDQGAPPIAFVQIAVATPANSVSTVKVTFGKAQAAGDLNVVVVGWNGTTMSTVQSISDSTGNSYTLAVGPTTFSPDLTQSIFYAPGIAAGTNSVTVTFVQPANLVDIRILEYSGLDPAAPFDAMGVATGNNAGPASAAVTTTTARELIFAAGMSTDEYSGAGANFTMRDVTSDGDMAEDRVVNAAGAYTAQSTLAGSCEWVMQVATFK